MKKKNHYQHLMGRDKKQIVYEMGQEFNFYPNNIWTYIIDNGWFGRKTMLLLFFKSEKVYEIKVKNFYGKIARLSED
ncbi:hypothetical protein SAMN05421841_1915 [Chryseobacterium wanjuense]|jgi:hypothetical protein|uniref:Uncharacterized protein n=1 Tax=Chryseobacterium wanjuense TaxID=356305 RepID=A0A1I0QIH4_9FLAO|nr:hypothetical protein [Chryseobacterium wanjuense]SEW26451.1 hypothetical protein SAMN05421841_1915 [Chryseobacterium wanjuense]